MVQDRLLLILAGQQGIILEQAKLAQRLIVQLKDQRRLGRPGRLTGFLIQRDHVHAYLRPHQHPAVLSEKGIAFLLFSTGIPLRSSYKPIDSLSKESPYSISSCGTICINPFAGSVKKESGPEVFRKLSTKAFNDTLQYKTIQSVFASQGRKILSEPICLPTRNYLITQDHCNPGCSKKQFYFVKGVDSHIKIIIIFVRNNKRIKKTVP